MVYYSNIFYIQTIIHLYKHFTNNPKTPKPHGEFEFELESEKDVNVSVNRAFKATVTAN